MRLIRELARGGMGAVHEVIHELDTIMDERFSTTFKSISSEFSAYFQVLFGGGTARLSLTNPEDLSETGVEIMALFRELNSSGVSLVMVTHDTELAGEAGRHRGGHARGRGEARLDATRAIKAMHCLGADDQKSRRDPLLVTLLHGVVGQQVTSKLLTQKLVVGRVRIHHLDDAIAITPCLSE